MGRTGLTVFLIIAVGVLLNSLLEPGDLLMPQSPPTGERTLPQTYLEQVRSLSYDETGKLDEIREARKLEHFDQRDESLLESPRFYSHNGGDKTWSAAADRGRYRPSERLLELSDNVVLANDNSGARLETSEMLIDLERKTARTEVPVTITRDESSTRADGAFADLEAEVVEMKPNVESIYVRPR